MRITFDEVYVRASKSGKCACGKRRVRSQKFSQTINPFNKMHDGRIKRRNDIIAELQAEIRAWRREPIACNACPQKQ